MMSRKLAALSAATRQSAASSKIHRGLAPIASAASTTWRSASTSSAGRSKDEASTPAEQAHDTRIDEVDHVRTTPLGRALLTAGSALGLLNNPARGDLLSMLTQVSSGPSLSHLLGLMRSTESGRRLLIERPSVNSETVDVEYLCSLERGKFGREWMEWLKENGVGPDGRAEADYMPTPEHKYLIQRYRESHDFYHLLLRMPVTQLGETVVKYFEMAQMNMPVAGFAAAGGTLRILASNLSSLPKPSQLLTAAISPSSVSNATVSAANPTSGDLAALQSLIPWAIEVGKTSVPLISVEWEKCWERDIDDMRREFGITRPPIAVARFAGRTARAGKRRGWPSKIVEHQKRKEQAQQQQKQSSSQSPSPIPAAHSESR